MADNVREATSGKYTFSSTDTQEENIAQVTYSRAVSAVSVVSSDEEARSLIDWNRRQRGKKRVSSVTSAESKQLRSD